LGKRDYWITINPQIRKQSINNTKKTSNNCVGNQRKRKKLKLKTKILTSHNWQIKELAGQS